MFSLSVECLASRLPKVQRSDCTSWRSQWIWHSRIHFSGGDLEVETPRPDPAQYRVAPLTKMQSLAPGAKTRHAAQEAEADQALRQALLIYEAAENGRLQALAEARSRHDADVQVQNDAANSHNRAVEAVEAQYKASDPDAVVNYMTQVVESVFYPEGFPISSRISYSPDSSQLVIELELPPIDSVPDVREYKFVKTKDMINSVVLPARERKLLYESALAQLVLRTIWAVLHADNHGKIETVILNGHVRSIDARTGADIYPCVVTVRTTRHTFQAVDLRRIDPVACLKGLNASVSRSPSELAPVRPILEFNMSDPRFVQEADVLSALDARPNLMELTPSEFESLITNLFERMGLETKLTQASRDGGVDCVAYDSRPILGGKVVIQAKRYKNTVGVSAVRDLSGTMMNEGASKGILVTTSGFGQASHDFANGKPLELLDGGNLLYLLKEHAGIDAKIEPPDDWVDPIPDS
jgi:restriction system protein